MPCDFQPPAISAPVRGYGQRLKVLFPSSGRDMTRIEARFLRSIDPPDQIALMLAFPVAAVKASSFLAAASWLPAASSVVWTPAARRKRLQIRNDLPSLRFGEF